MRIEGRWLRFPDQDTRPIIRARVLNVEQHYVGELFLVDTGSDRTVLSADLLRDLRLSSDQPPSATTLMGIGGNTAFVLVRTTIEFSQNDGPPATIYGEFAAFTDPRATDVSILARDVLDNFDVIVSRRREEVLLLAPNHHYEVTRR